MLPVLPGPYRDDHHHEIQDLKKDRRIKELEDTLKKSREDLEYTQQALASERLENRLLRGTARFKRTQLLFYGILRYGFTRAITAAAATVFTATLILTMSAHQPSPPPAPSSCRFEHHLERPRPTISHTMVLPLPASACYTHLMCRECAFNPFAVWTWGGERPYPLKPYNLEVTLVAFSN